MAGPLSPSQRSDGHRWPSTELVLGKEAVHPPTSVLSPASLACPHTSRRPTMLAAMRPGRAEPPRRMPRLTSPPWDQPGDIHGGSARVSPAPGRRCQAAFLLQSEPPPCAPKQHIPPSSVCTCARATPRPPPSHPWCSNSRCSPNSLQNPTSGAQAPRPGKLSLSCEVRSFQNPRGLVLL